MTREQPLETRRHFLSRSGALIAGLTGLPLVPPATAESVEPSSSLDLGLERASVLFELGLFERHYLPALHAPFSLDHSDGEPRLYFCQSKEYRLEQWQAATRRIAGVSGLQGATAGWPRSGPRALPSGHAASRERNVRVRLLLEIFWKLQEWAAAALGAPARLLVWLQSFPWRDRPRKEK